MEYRRLGSSELNVSAVGLGANNFGGRMDDPDTAVRIIHTAVEHGINLIDTADHYGGDHRSEEFIGRAIKGMRSDVLIATKVGRPIGEGPDGQRISRRHITETLEASLRALGTDYIDLYQIHRPDPDTPAQETLRALDDAVLAGKVRYVGCSNYAAWQACEAAWVSRTDGLAAFVSVQNLYSMLDRDVEGELMPFCREYDVGFLPYYPLAGGFLTGKYRRGEPVPAGTRMALAAGQARRWLTEPNFDLLDRLEAFCAERDRSVADLAFAWLLASPQVSSVIAGASRPEQVAANAASAEWALADDEKAEVDAILGT